MQFYPVPSDVAIPVKFWPTAYGVKRVRKHIAQDGLIVPILVHHAPSEGFVVADEYQAERVLACKDLGFETVLVETEWTDEDL